MNIVIVEFGLINHVLNFVFILDLVSLCKKFHILRSAHVVRAGSPESKQLACDKVSVYPRTCSSPELSWLLNRIEFLMDLYDDLHASMYHGYALSSFCQRTSPASHVCLCHLERVKN